jgi:transposase
VANKHQDKRSAWVMQLEERRGKNISAVAVANKNARVAWALLSNKSTYQASAA